MTTKRKDNIDTINITVVSVWRMDCMCVVCEGQQWIRGHGLGATSSLGNTLAAWETVVAVES